MAILICIVHLVLHFLFECIKHCLELTRNMHNQIRSYSGHNLKRPSLAKWQDVVFFLALGYRCLWFFTTALTHTRLFISPPFSVTPPWHCVCNSPRQHHRSSASTFLSRLCYLGEDDTVVWRFPLHAAKGPVLPPVHI